LNTLDATNTSRIATVAIDFYFDGLAVRPSDGTLFAAGPNFGDISIINPVNGNVTFVGNTGPTRPHPSDLDFRVIPEPGSRILLVLGLLCIVVYGWRCRKRSAEGHVSP
jgi:hypothetical protein